MGPIFESIQRANERLLQDAAQAMSNIAQSVVQQGSMQRAFSQALQQVVHQQTQALQEAFAAFAELADQRLEEARSASKAIGPPLIEADFWIPPSAAFELSHRLKTLVDNGQATPDNIRAAIVEYYEAEAFSQLRDMVESWEDNPQFAGRLHIIKDALDAHIAGKYSLSIPALLPQVEGILTSIVGKRNPKVDGGMEKWAGAAIEKGYGTLELEVYKDALIRYITGIKFYGSIRPDYFTPVEYSNWLKTNGLKGSQVLNRHAILHGVQIDYASKENSLRAFFILDVLAWISGDGQ